MTTDYNYDYEPKKGMPLPTKIILGFFALLFASLLIASAVGYLRQQKTPSPAPTPAPMENIESATPQASPTSVPINPDINATLIPPLPRPSGDNWIAAFRDGLGYTVWIREVGTDEGCQESFDEYHQDACAGKKIQVFLTGEGRNQYWLNGWDLSLHKQTLHFDLQVGLNVVEIPPATTIGIGTTLE